MILPVLAMLLSGCGLFGSTDLAPTAQQYYDFTVGQGGNQKYSNFFSPAYKSQFSDEGLRQLDQGFGTSKPTNRYQPIKLEDIAVSTEGTYGLSRANPELGVVYAKLGAVKWIRVGKAWYLYLNSDAEISAYGHFLTNLPPPQFMAAPSDEEN